jgi:hypothetical protein
MHPRFPASHAAPLLALFVASAAFAQRQSNSAIADFNGDGKPDLVRPAGNTGAFGLALGNGDGTFQSFIIITFNSVPSTGCFSIAAADFNGDGKQDVAVGCGGGAGNPNSYLAVMLGNGDGTFQPAAIYGTATAPIPISVGDLNGDGKPDMVAGIGTGGTGGVPAVVFLNKGDGTFMMSDFVLSDKFIAASVLADFNGDQKLDLAFLRGNGDVRVYLGNGDGTFTFSHEYAVHPPEIFQGYLAFADFNGDGKLDLIATANLSPAKVPNTYAILFGSGDGTFQPAQLHPGPRSGSATGVVTGDFNGDGKADFAVASWDPAQVSVFLGNGDGSFQKPTNYSIAGSPFSTLLLADLNGDGKPDIVAPDSNKSLINNGDGTFHEVTMLPKQ